MASKNKKKSSVPVPQVRNARIYARVSTTMQADEGMSLETQKIRMRNYCAFKGLNVIKDYEDAGHSGGTMHRPAMEQMIEDILEHEVVVVADLSRLGRNLHDALDFRKMLQERGAELICVNGDLDFSTPIGNLLFQILMSVNEMERRQIGSAVSVNLERLSAEKKLRSRPPFGYKFVGKNENFEKDADQQVVLLIIFGLFERGISYTSIANRLNEEKLNECLKNNKKKQDKTYKFSAQIIRRILIDHGKITIPNNERMSLEQRLKCHRSQEQHDADISDLLTVGGTSTSAANSEQDTSQD